MLTVKSNDWGHWSTPSSMSRRRCLGARSLLFRDPDGTLINFFLYGLIGYVFGEDSLALRTALRIEAGMVGVNNGVLSDPAAPFGGTKQSGLGREGSSEASWSTSRRSTSAWSLSASQVGFRI